MNRRVVFRSRLQATAEEAFQWHARPGAFERLAPPWARVKVVERRGGIESGARVILSVPAGPFRLRWVAEHGDYVEGRRFRDAQVWGPFRLWEHTHRFVPTRPGACLLEDHIEYVLPLGPLGDLAAGRYVRRDLGRVFAYRHRVTRDDIADHGLWRDRPRLTIAVSGSHGLVGSALVPFLTTGGHRVIRLTRGAPRPGEASARWDPESGTIDAAALEGVDAVVHLAGEPLGEGRWSFARKSRIRSSREAGTRALAEAIANLHRPPRVLVSASAVGYYGDRGAAVLAEESGPGTGFLPEVCVEWEEATAPAAAAGIRVVTPRIGMVLTPAGGALARVLPFFRAGLGGPTGSGIQYVSWIALDDLLGVILRALHDDGLRGAINTVAPVPVTNRRFAAILGRVLRRPAVFPAPAFALRAAFGEMAEALLLASARAHPARLIEAGHRFRHPELEGALRYLLGREQAVPAAASRRQAAGSRR